MNDEIMGKGSFPDLNQLKPEDIQTLIDQALDRISGTGLSLPARQRSQSKKAL